MGDRSSVPKAGKAVRVLGAVARRLFRCSLSTRDRLALSVLCSAVGRLASPRSLVRRLIVFGRRRSESLRRLPSLRLTQLCLGPLGDALADHAVALIQSQASTLRSLQVYSDKAPVLPEEPLEALPQLRRLILIKWPECAGLLALAPSALASLQVFSPPDELEVRDAEEVAAELRLLADTLQRLPSLRHLMLDPLLEGVWGLLGEETKARLRQIPQLRLYLDGTAESLPMEEILSELESPVSLDMETYLSARFAQLRPSAWTSVRALRLSLYLGTPDKGLDPAYEPCCLLTLLNFTGLQSLDLILRVFEDEKLWGWANMLACLAELPLDSLCLSVCRFSPTRLEPLNLHLPKTLRSLVVKDKIWFRKDGGYCQPVPLASLAEERPETALRARLSNCTGLRSLTVYGHPGTVESFLESDALGALERVHWLHCPCRSREISGQPDQVFAGRLPGEAFRGRMAGLRGELSALLRGRDSGLGAALSLSLSPSPQDSGLGAAPDHQELRQRIRRLGLCVGPQNYHHPLFNIEDSV